MLGLYLDEVYHVALVAVGLAHGCDASCATIRLHAIDAAAESVTLEIEDGEFLTLRRVRDDQPASYVHNEAGWVWSWAKS